MPIFLRFETLLYQNGINVPLTQNKTLKNDFIKSPKTMEKFKTIALIILSLVLVVLSCLFVHQSLNNTDSMVSTVKTDTLYVHDTIEIEVKKDSIVYRDRKVVDTLFLPTPQDTTLIPIEQKHYVDTLADIWISGYEPTIDSIHYHIPRNTTYVEKTIEIEKPKKWYEDRFCFTVGVYGGYSPIYNNFDVIVGGGLSIRIGK